MVPVSLASSSFATVMRPYLKVEGRPRESSSSLSVVLGSLVGVVGRVDMDGGYY